MSHRKRVSHTKVGIFIFFFLFFETSFQCHSMPLFLIRCQFDTCASHHISTKTTSILTTKYTTINSITLRSYYGICFFIRQIFRNRNRPQRPAHLPHGKRREIFFLEFMDKQLTLGEPIRPLLLDFYNDYDVHPRTTRWWWNHYLDWGESPSETKQKMKKFKKFTVQK